MKPKKTGNEGKNVALMRDRLRILGALLAAPLLGLGARQASADAVTKKKAKKKVAKRKVAKKKVMKVSEPGTLALLGAGLAVAGVARKMGRRKKKIS
jgi:hypothetical protein